MDYEEAQKRKNRKGYAASAKKNTNARLLFSVVLYKGLAGSVVHAR